MSKHKKTEILYLHTIEDVQKFSDMLLREKEAGAASTKFTISVFMQRDVDFKWEEPGVDPCACLSDLKAELENTPQPTTKPVIVVKAQPAQPPRQRYTRRAVAPDEFSN